MFKNYAKNNLLSTANQRTFSLRVKVFNIFKIFLFSFIFSVLCDLNYRVVPVQRFTVYEKIIWSMKELFV